MIRQLTLALLIALPGAALAAEPAPLPRCDAPEHRQFDFWVGAWEVENTKDGKPAGKSLVEALYDGCGVRENWKSPRVSGGSLNMYDREDKVWKQNWIDSTGGRLDFTGGWTGQAMVLTAKGPGAWSRMTFTPNADGSVRQFGEASSDQGATWTADYDFTYRKAP